VKSQITIDSIKQLNRHYPPNGVVIRKRLRTYGQAETSVLIILDKVIESQYLESMANSCLLTEVDFPLQLDKLILDHDTEVVGFTYDRSSFGHEVEDAYIIIVSPYDEVIQELSEYVTYVHPFIEYIESRLGQLSTNLPGWKALIIGKD
jgi:hypothetical protein